MILKKPYAFLIKYFKLIHLVLSFLLVFIIVRTYNIIIFFNDYIQNNYTATIYEGFVSDYVPFLLFFSTFVLLGIVFALILLLKNKKKPSRLYEITFVYFLIYFILLFVTRGIFASFEKSILSAELARIYRDISMIVILPQIPLLIINIVRGFGFNVKKFEFEKDLKDLEITEEDSEEFELNISHDGYKFRRQLRRFVREFNYYIKENKFIFSCIIIALLLILPYVIYSSLPTKYNSNYKQNDTFTYRGLQVNIMDSIVTNIDYKGEKIDKNYYVVLKIKIDNNTDDAIDLKADNFRLEIDKEYLYPTLDKRDNFLDYGTNYYGMAIPKQSSNIYALIYKINKEQIKHKYNIKIDKGITANKNEFIDVFDYIKIEPLFIDSVSTVLTKKINEEFSLNGSNLGNTKLKVGDYQITPRYEYSYEYCFNADKCTSYKDFVSVSYLENGKTLLVFDYNFKLDKEVPYARYNKNISTFIEKFMKVKYKDENNMDKYSNIINVTPDNLKGKLVVEVDEEVNLSSEYSIAFIIRNKEYLIRLK